MLELTKKYRQILPKNIIIICILGMNLGGCGVHFHNAANEAQARKASDSFKAADIGKYIDAERQVVKATNERNLTAIRRHTSAERDRLLVMALAENTITVGKFKEKIDSRMGSIGFPIHTETQKILFNLKDNLLNALVSRDYYLVRLSGTKKMSSPSFPPSEADEKAANSSQDADIIQLFSNYKRYSDKYFKLVDTLKSLDNGEIGKLNVKITEIATIRVNINLKIADANKQLQTALKEYEKETNSGKKSAVELKLYQKKIEDALDKFDQITKNLEPAATALGIDDLLAEVHLEKLKAEREQVGKFLDAYSKAESDKTGASTEKDATNAEIAGKVAAVITGMSNEIHDSATQTKLVPLMFEQQRLRLEIARMQRMVERGEQHILLLEKQRDSFIAEGLRLMDARGLLSATNDDVSLESFFRSDKKEYLLRALIQMSQAITVDKRHEREIENALITLDHDEALDNSEFSLGLWKLMIASPLEQLVNYHASGITADDVSKLLQAASLAGIAVGVNR